MIPEIITWIPLQQGLSGSRARRFLLACGLRWIQTQKEGELCSPGAEVHAALTLSKEACMFPSQVENKIKSITKAWHGQPLTTARHLTYFFSLGLTSHFTKEDLPVIEFLIFADNYANVIISGSPWGRSSHLQGKYLPKTTATRGQDQNWNTGGQGAS